MNNQTIKNVSGTPYYIAPENILEPQAVRGDVWSLGIVMYIMLSGKASKYLLTNV